jgi:hypothetical protein
MRSGEIEANLLTLNEHAKLPHISDLVRRKLAGPEQSVLEQSDFVFHYGEYQRLRAELQSAMDQSCLPEAPSAQPALNDLLVRARVGTMQ